jgi:glycosyltransferase involved in cell wall biosynthesis
MLMLNYEFPPLGGGAGNANRYILKELARYPDLRIDLVTASTDRYRREQFSENIRIHYLNINKKDGSLQYQTDRDLLIYAWKAYRYSRKLIKEYQYDLCHAFFGIPCGYLAMKLGLPYIVSLRGSDVPFYNRRFYWPDRLFFRYLSKKIWRKAHKVIANSAGLKELAQSACPGQEIDVIGNGVDLQEFCPADENKKEVGGKIRLISVGRLIERKGYRYLIEALKDLPDVDLQLIGEGNLRKELEELAFKYGIPVQFLGNISHQHLPRYLLQADIFVLPSLNEGMSNSVLEAMACGLPVITTDTGGSKELVQGNGFLVKKGDAQDLRRAIEIFIRDKSLIGVMGKKSRENAEKMSWRGVVAAYSELYVSCYLL